MVCLRNISVDTLHKGDTKDNNNNNNNNNNNKSKMWNVNGVVPLRAVTTCRFERACNIAVRPRPKTISGKDILLSAARPLYLHLAVFTPRTFITNFLLNVDIFMVRGAPIHSSPDEIIQPIFQITFLLCWSYYIVQRQRAWYCLLFMTGLKKGTGNYDIQFKTRSLSTSSIR
jgi:hypothetical protein